MIQGHQFRQFMMLLKLALKFLNDSKILHFFGIMSEIHHSYFVILGHWINSTLRPRQYIFAQIIVCSLSFFSILPMAIAIFPQTGTISKSNLEPEFQNVKEETLRYNKGL